MIMNVIYKLNKILLVLCFQFFLGCNNNEKKDDNTLSQIETVAPLESKISNQVQSDYPEVWNVFYGGSDHAAEESARDILPIENDGCIIVAWVAKNIKKVDEVSENRGEHLIRFDKDGNIVWDILLPSDINFHRRGISMYKDELLLLGYNYSTDSNFIVTFNIESGELQNRNKILGKKGDFLYVTKQNRIYIVGKTPAPFIYEINYDGIMKSEINFEKTYNSEILSLTEDNNGNLYFTGTGSITNSEGIWLGSITDNCVLLWNKTHIFSKNSDNDKGNSILFTTDNKLIIVGYNNSNDNSLYSSEDKNLIVAKFDLNGNLEKKNLFEGHMYNMRKGIVEVEGEYYFISRIDSKVGNTRLCLKHLSNSISEKRSFVFDYHNARPTALCKSSSGNYLFTVGSEMGFPAPGPGYYDIVLNKINHSGINTENNIVYNVDLINDNSPNNSNFVDLDNLEQVNKFLKLYRFDDNEILSGRNENYTFNLSFNPKDSYNGYVVFTSTIIKSNGLSQTLTQKIYDYTISQNRSGGYLYFETKLGYEALYLMDDGTIVMDDKSRNEKYYFKHSAD